MPTATMTSKGQVVIPSEIRRVLNLHPGDRINFRLDSKEHSVKITPMKKNVDDVFGMLKGRGIGKYTCEEIDEAIGKAFGKGIL